MVFVKNNNFKRVRPSRKSKKLAEDLSTFFESLNVSETKPQDTSNSNVLTSIKTAITSNDFVFMLWFIKQNYKTQFDVETFHILGKFASAQLYTMLRNSDVFDNYIDDCLYFDAIIEGASISDNFELISHMTNTHQFSNISSEKLCSFGYAFIERKAYKCLSSIVLHLSHQDNEGKYVLKQLLKRTMDYLDTKMVALVLKGLSHATPPLLTYHDTNSTDMMVM